ncbi:MAG: tripartite tricarboxylate transporter substrate-binding protein [Betaproteobacteria bacterium]|nr:tripartite tricarboxylate transporter substrate-binding protein [Betaproteobacteria bacterium]MDH3437608.1 tripartite tricarboxylate transporter substrate-binding protein [Betaproteobacteria bacterium]
MKTWKELPRLALLVALLALLPAQAQNYPSRLLRVIVPLAAGGGMDTVTRSLARKLAESLRQNVVVDNRPGAGSLIGLGILAGSTPDGRTLMMVSATTVIHPILYKSRFDIVRDFTPTSSAGASRCHLRPLFHRSLT